MKNQIYFMGANSTQKVFGSTFGGAAVELLHLAKEKKIANIRSMKAESILIAFAVVCIGTVAVRMGTHKAPAKKARTVAAIAVDEHVSSTDMAPVLAKKRYTNNTAKFTSFKRDAQCVARSRNSKVQNKHDVMLAYYQKLQALPGMELHRLEWLEKMARGPFTSEDLSKFSYTEILSSSPLPDLSERDNARRRTAVGLAFNMFLENCGRFESCHEQAVAALVQTSDQKLRSEMFKAMADQYSDSWQQEQLYVQMQRYGLTTVTASTAAISNPSAGSSQR